MDCYIVRVYRHITHQNGQADEIAGLVELVGDEARSKPFSTYMGLVEAIREDFDTDDVTGMDTTRSVYPLRGRQ